MSRSRRFVADVSWSLAGQVVLALVNIGVVPAMIRGLGTEGYGLYIMMNSAAAYLPVLALGIGSALIKFLSEHDGASEGRAVRGVMRAGAWIHFGTAALGGAALWLAAPRLAATFLRVPGVSLDDAILVLRAAAVGGAFLSGLQWAMASLQGLRRFDLQSLIVVSQGVLMPAGALLLIARGCGMVAISWWFAALNAACFLAAAACVLRSVAQVPESGPPAKLRPFLLFSLGLWPGPMAWIVSNQVDKLFVLRVQQLASLALYAVPTAALQRLQVLPAAVSSVLLPTISAASRPESAETLRRIYVRVMRIMLSLLWPAYALLFAFMPQLLSLWLGGRFGDDSVWPARLLVAGQAIGVMSYIPNSVAVGLGRPLFASSLAWLQAGCSLVLWIALVPRYGILGAAAGTAAGQALPALGYAFFVQSRLLSLGWLRFLSEGMAAPCISSAALLAAAMAVHAQGSTWPRLFLFGGVGAALCYALVWLLLSADDHDLALSLLKIRPKKA